MNGQQQLARRMSGLATACLVLGIVALVVIIAAVAMVAYVVIWRDTHCATVLGTLVCRS